MTAHSSETRELREDERTDEESQSRARRAASAVANVNENGWVSMLLGGVLLARGAQSFARSDSRGRALLHGVAGAALLAVGLRQRRSGGDEESTTDLGSSGEASEDVSDEAAAHREQSKVLGQDETNPRGTSGEPDVEQQTDAGNVEFSDEQDLESGRKPGMDEESADDPRTDEEAEIDLSEASMADEASEAAGPASTQAQPAQTDTTEPETSPEEDDSTMTQDTTDDHETEDEPDPDADPGEATEEATSAESADVADEIIEEEIDDEEREGVKTEGGATVHTDTNESDNMDIDVDDVTDPDDDMNTEAEDSDEQSSSHLDEDPPDEEEGE